MAYGDCYGYADQYSAWQYGHGRTVWQAKQGQSRVQVVIAGRGADELGSLRYSRVRQARGVHFGVYEYGAGSMRGLLRVCQ